jgi:hypothetical protein
VQVVVDSQLTPIAEFLVAHRAERWTVLAIVLVVFDELRTRIALGRTGSGDTRCDDKVFCGHSNGDFL